MGGGRGEGGLNAVVKVHEALTRAMLEYQRKL